ncbi:MAG: response regulator transcription factor [Firmicutes bacterium]|nr:response regulator transcription factor [Bacillota bacterium]
MATRHPILLVDDEVSLRELVRLYLNRSGFEVEETGDGRDAVAKIQKANYSCVVLDIGLPGMSGWDVCQEIRNVSRVPILMLTARGEVQDRITGLNMGADDYVVKPFDPRELVARVQALLRRTDPEGPEPPLQIDSLKVDPASRRVFVNEAEVQLTATEFDLLYFLARNQGRVFTRDELLSKVWGYDYPGDSRTVDAHVKTIRAKVESAGGRRDWIQTVWGVGYRWEGQE